MSPVFLDGARPALLPGSFFTALQAPHAVSGFEGFRYRIMARYRRSGFRPSIPLLLIWVMVNGAQAEPGLLLNSAVATAGQQVDLHLLLTAPEGGSVRSLAFELQFPRDELVLSGVERSYQLEQLGVEVKREDSADGLRLEFVLPEDRQEALPPGGMAFLSFTVSGSTSPQVLVVSAGNIRMTTGGGEVLMAEPVEAQINVVSEELYPLISCFFYMH